LCCTCGIGASLALLGPLAYASVENWTGGDGNDSNWTSNGNWDGIGGAGPDDELHFPLSASRKTNVNDFPINTNFGRLVFEGSSYSISGQQIFLGANGTTGGISSMRTTAGGFTFGPNILLGKSQTFDNNFPFPYALSGVINLQGHTLTLTGGGTHDINGVINGTGTLVMNGTQGSGVAILQGVSSGFGTSIINSGTLQVGAGGAIGAATINGGTLRADGTVGAAALQAGTLTGNGPVGNITASTAVAKTIAPAGPAGTVTDIMSTGAVTLSSSTTLAIDLRGLTIGSQYDSLSTTSITLNGANLSLAVAGFTPVVGNQFTIVSGTVVGATKFAQANSITAAGIPFSITYNANSMVLTVLSSVRTWKGGAGGGSSWSLAANWVGGTAPLAGDSLVFPQSVNSKTSSNDYAANTLFSSIALDGTGYLIPGNAINLKNGISENSSSGSGSSLSMPIKLVQAQAFDALNNGFTLSGTLDLNGFPLTVAGAGPVRLTGIISGAGGITKNGSGSSTLSGVNTYTGVTQISAGTLIVVSNNALGATTAGNDTVVSAGASLAIGLGLTATSEPITLNGIGAGGAGALRTNASGSCGGCEVVATLAGPVTLASNSSIDLGQLVNFDRLTITGAIGDAGGARTLTATGKGTLILNAANTYTGGTVVNGSTVLVNGAIGAVTLDGASAELGGTGTVGAITGLAGGGIVDPNTIASTGVLNASGNVALAPQSVLSIEIGGLVAGTDYDQLNVTGTVDLGGADLSGALIGSFIPAAGNQFTIIQSTGLISGQFANSSPITFNGASFNIIYNSNSVVLTAIAGGQADLIVVKSHSGNFARAQVGATYEALVTNSGIADMPASLVSLTETPPAGLTLTAMSGSGWTCVIPTCTRADSLSAFLSYPPITITVDVANNATSPLINSVAVTTAATESDLTNNTGTDSTIIDPGDVIFADGFE